MLHNYKTVTHDIMIQTRMIELFFLILELFFPLLEQIAQMGLILPRWPWDLILPEYHHQPLFFTQRSQTPFRDIYMGFLGIYITCYIAFCVLYCYIAFCVELDLDC